MIAERVITVEYLEPSMSRELLFKFPDASVFDFDYSQSGIWSPLVPRRQASFFSGSSPPRKRRRIAASPMEKLFEEKLELSNLNGAKNLTKNMDRQCPHCSKGPAQKSTSRKGWGNVLKAASKRFKRTKAGVLPIKLSIF